MHGQESLSQTESDDEYCEGGDDSDPFENVRITIREWVQEAEEDGDEIPSLKDCQEGFEDDKKVIAVEHWK